MPFHVLQGVQMLCIFKPIKGFRRWSGGTALEYAVVDSVMLGL